MKLNLIKGALALGVAACAFAIALSAIQAAAPLEDWPFYGGGPEHIRYSPLKQINRSNVAKLRVAWSFDTEDGGGYPETQPIMVGGIVYGVTPRHKVVALDAATGKLIWRFDSGIEGRGPNRGLVYWKSGNDTRIFAAVTSYIYALDAKTGRIVTTFGKDGRIDLRDGLDRDPATQSLNVTTPGVIYKDLMIVGVQVPESLPAPPGSIRAYEVKTGKLRWSFHTVPHPGEFGYDTWPRDVWTFSGAATAWTGFALDEKRGIVFAPTGNPVDWYYGGDRAGDNLFSDSLLALNAESGQRLWHFQGVRHDIWDRDFPSPPSLVTVRHDGKLVDAVAQTSKQGFVYLFERATGRPLFPLEEKAYPPSDVPGEHTAPRQVLPVKPAPFARQFLTEAMLSNRTPEVHQRALEQFRTFTSGGQFVPFGFNKEVVLMPGFDGGAEWGGSAFDPATGILYINSNDVAFTSSLSVSPGGNSGRQLYLDSCGSCHGESLTGAPPQIPALTNLPGKMDAQAIAAIIRQGAGRMPAFPNWSAADVQSVAQYVLSGESRDSREQPSAGSAPARRMRGNGYHKFSDADGYPAIAPPWGTLNAINLNTGEYAWKIPLGEYPELAAAGMKNTGSENYGGPVVTAGGLVVIAATNFDEKIRAFDKSSGKLLWEATLPFGGNATPITYEAGGKQYIVISATSGGKFGRRGGKSGGMYVAFALP